MRHEANDGVVLAWFKYDILHCLKWYKLGLRLRLPTLAMRYLVSITSSLPRRKMCFLREWRAANSAPLAISISFALRSRLANT